MHGVESLKVMSK